MQSAINRLNHINRHYQGQSKHFGGIFSPLAQYPGASYAEILAEKNEQPVRHEPKLQNQEKTFSRSETLYLKCMLKNALPFKNALLLVDMESNASLDRMALREAGLASVRVFTSGLQAAKSLNNDESEVDIVFCHARFEDMSAVQWIELMRSHPRLKNMPVVALASGAAEEKLLQAVFEGFDDLLTRPYSPKLLHERLMQLRPLTAVNNIENTSDDNFNVALQRYESCKTEDGKAQFNIEEGLRFVQQKKWDSAIQCFTKALLHKDFKGEAELGLAAAWRGKEHTEKFRYFLYEASLTFTRMGNWAKARSAYMHLLKVMPNTPSPFVRTMQTLIRAGSYAQAAETLVQGFDLSEHENISKHIVRACLYTENPQFTLQKVKQFFDDPALSHILKSLDADLQEAFDAHATALEKSRRERAKLEQKAREHKAREHKTKSALVASGSMATTTALTANANLAQDTQSRSLVDLSLDDDQGYDFAEDFTDDLLGADAEDNSILEEIPGMPSLMEDDYVKKNAVPLMNENELETQLFSSFPGLNEAATVIKTTWKLMKKS